MERPRHDDARARRHPGGIGLSFTLELTEDQARLRDRAHTFAREVIRAGFPSDSTEQLEHRVELRLQRQSLLERPDAPTLWVVMEEAAPVAGQSE